MSHPSVQAYLQSKKFLLAQGGVRAGDVNWQFLCRCGKWVCTWSGAKGLQQCYKEWWNY